MAVTRLNHAVLYVGNVDRSVSFYNSVFGFEPVEGMAELRGAAFLRAPGSTNDHDLGLFEVGPDAGPSGAGRATVGLYHLAWEVDTLADLEEVGRRLSGAGALVGASDHGTTKSLYGRDPDGLEFEVVWIIPAALLTADDLDNRARIRPLDLEHEKQRFGPATPGGIGVSQPALPRA